MNKFLSFNQVYRTDNQITINLAGNWFVEYDFRCKKIYFNSMITSNSHTLDYSRADITDKDFDYVVRSIDSFLKDDNCSYYYLDTSIESMK